MKYDLRSIMTWAWKQYRADGELSFAECLHRSWLTTKAAPVNAERIRQAAAAAGIKERYNTWQRWRMMGFEVIHGSKAAFGADLIWGSKGDGVTYKARFFTESQVRFVA